MSVSFAGCQFQISIGSELPSTVCINYFFVFPIQFCESDLLKISLQSRIRFCESNLLIFARLALRNRAACLHVRQTFSRPSNKVKKVSHPKDMKYVSMQHNSFTSILMKPKLTVFMFTRRDPLAMTKSLKV